MKLRTPMIALFFVAFQVSAQSTKAPTGKYFDISGQFLRPYGTDSKSNCTYTRRPGGEDWDFGLLVPKEEPLVLAGGGGRYLVLPGLLKHEQDPELQTLACAWEPGYDFVYAVINVERCRITRFISMTVDPDLSRFALAAEEPVLLVGEKGATKVYAGPDFTLAGEVPVKTVLFGRGAYPQWVSAFSNGFVVAPAVGGSEEKGALFLTVRMQGLKLENWKLVQVPLPKPDCLAKAAPRLPAGTSKGEATQSLEPVFADSHWIVLRCKSNLRQGNQAVAGQGVLWGYNYANATLATVPLDPDATLLNVKAAGENRLEVEFSKGGSKSKSTLVAPTLNQ
jgi:hypothetical protein